MGYANRRYRYPFQQERDLRNAVLAGDRSASRSTLEALVRAFEESTSGLEAFRSDAVQVLVVLTRKCYRTGVPVDDLMADLSRHVTELVQATTAEAIHTKLRDLVERLVNAVKSQGSEDRRASVAKVVHYIRQHAREGLTLQDAAAMAGVSYFYFSRIFTEQTGVPFQVFLTQVRLESARNLLVSTQLTVDEVATQVGYDDPRHFTRLFKRYYATTPRKYARAQA